MKDQSNTFNLTESDQDLLKALGQVEQGKPLIVRQNEKELAALISLEDLDLLERLIEEEEDRIDREEAKKVLAEVKEEGTVSWESIKAELRL